VATKLLTIELMPRPGAWQLKNAFDIRAVSALKGLTTYASERAFGHFGTECARREDRKNGA